MNKKWIPYLLILVMAVAVIVIKTCKANNQSQPKVSTSENRKDTVSNKTNRDKGFDRRTSYIEYSNPPRLTKEQSSLISPRPGGDVFLQNNNFNRVTGKMIALFSHFHISTFSYLQN